MIIFITFTFFIHMSSDLQSTLKLFSSRARAREQRESISYSECCSKKKNNNNTHILVVGERGTLKETRNPMPFLSLSLYSLNSLARGYI